jgi:hypothetical protein
MDTIELCLLVLLGSAITYLLDAVFNFIPHLADWIGKAFD